MTSLLPAFTAAALFACSLNAIAGEGYVAALAQRLQPSIGLDYARAVATDGQRAVVGAHPHALVYDKVGDQWVETAVLVGGGAAFGSGVAIEGDLIAVSGASNSFEIGVWMFHFDGTDWNLEASHAVDGTCYFGWAPVALDGDTVALGAPLDHDINNVVTDFGRVAVYRRAASSWMLEQEINTFDAAPGDSFGSDVDLFGDTLIAGAVGDADGSNTGGSAYIYQRTGSAWNFEQKVFNPSLSTISFGGAVAGSANRVAVGAAGDDIGGSVSTYTRSGSSWSLEQEFSSSDIQLDDWFGSSVDLDGDLIVVDAARADLPSIVDAGATYLFAWDGSSWCQEDKLVVDALPATSAFGRPVHMTGETFIVGARLDETASVFQAGVEQGTPFCTAGTNSLGSAASIVAMGSSRVQDDDFTLAVQGGVPNQFAILFYGPTQVQIPLGSGTRCVDTITRLFPIERFNEAGTILRTVDLGLDPVASDITNMVPITMNFQLWYRDGQDTNLSDAVSVTFVP